MAWFFFHQITCKAYADINEIGVRSILKTCFANPIDISLQSWTDSPALNVMQYEYAHEVQASKQQSQLQLAPASAQQLAEGYERVVVFPVCPVCRIHVRAESRSFLFFFFSYFISHWQKCVGHRLRAVLRDQKRSSLDGCNFTRCQESKIPSSNCFCLQCISVLFLYF